jgi:hypothetical protein
VASEVNKGWVIEVKVKRLEGDMVTITIGYDQYCPIKCRFFKSLAHKVKDYPILETCH